MQLCWICSGSTSSRSFMEEVALVAAFLCSVSSLLFCSSCMRHQDTSLLYVVPHVRLEVRLHRFCKLFRMFGCNVVQSCCCRRTMPLYILHGLQVLDLSFLNASIATMGIALARKRSVNARVCALCVCMRSLLHSVDPSMLLLPRWA